jgi:predicted nucleic acid-binding protein
VTRLVVDASVAAKWMLPATDELLRKEAFDLLDAYGAGEVSLIVPDVFWAECGNIVWKAVRRRRMPRADAELAIVAMMARAIPTISSRRLLPEALPIALNFGCAVYDCLYVALAVLSETELITADERVANALAARFPVKWLGAL